MPKLSEKFYFRSDCRTRSAGRGRQGRADRRGQDRRWGKERRKVPAAQPRGQDSRRAVGTEIPAADRGAAAVPRAASARPAIDSADRAHRTRLSTEPVVAAVRLERTLVSLPVRVLHTLRPRYRRGEESHPFRGALSSPGARRAHPTERFFVADIIAHPFN